MPDPAVFNGEELLIQIGDGADPEVFAHPCLINAERGIQFSSTVNSEIVPPCEETGLPGWNSTDIDGLNATINGAGMMRVGAEEEYFTWYNSGASKTVRVKVNKEGGRSYEGKFRLSEFSFSGTRKQKVTANLTLVSDGPVTLVPVA